MVRIVHERVIDGTYDLGFDWLLCTLVKICNRFFEFVLENAFAARALARRSSHLPRRVLQESSEDLASENSALASTMRSSHGPGEALQESSEDLGFN